MTGPIQSNPNARTPTTPPPAGGRGAPPATDAATGRTLSGPSQLGRAPAPQGTSAGEGSASASTRRASLPPTTRAGSSRGPSGSTSSSLPQAPRLSDLAQRLSKLEQERTELAARLDAAKQVRQQAAGNAGNAESRATIRKLQDRLDRANQQLSKLRLGRSEQLGRLERAERLLASCERSLEALTLNDEPARAAKAPSETAPKVLTAEEAQRPEPSHSQISAEEAAAQKRVRDLTEASRKATRELDRAKQVIVDARKGVDSANAAAAAAINPDGYMPEVDALASNGLSNYLRTLGLPPVHEPRARGNDPRFAAYLEHFTEAAPDGTRTLKPAFQEPREAFAAFSALHGAMSDNAYDRSLLDHLLPENLHAIGESLLNGGQDLEAAVRPVVIATFMNQVALSDELAASSDRRRHAVLPRRSHTASSGVMTRQQVRDSAQRNRILVQLQNSPMHRAAIMDGAVHQICAVLRSVVLPRLDVAGRGLAEAKARLQQANTAQRPAFAQSVSTQRELQAAREELGRLAEERRQREAAAPKPARPPSRTSDAPIPQVEVASSSSSGDAEARELKLRGDKLVYGEQADKLRQEVAASDEQIRQAESELRRIEDELESAAAEQAREAEGRQRQHGEHRDEVGKLRRDLNQLDARIAQARSELDSSPARKAIVSDRAWERTIERHLDPSDDEMRARAKFTGYTGVYTSRAELAEAAMEIHGSVSQRPEFQAVFAARNRWEFERAAAALPGGVIDLVHDHGRPVGRGFSNDPDQTERATELTQSNFSLQFVQGRVVISHLYPYVPHRQLTTA